MGDVAGSTFDYTRHAKWTQLSTLFNDAGWGTNPQPLQAALSLLQGDPAVVHHAVSIHWEVKSEEFCKGLPLRTFLPYHEHLSVKDLQFLVDLRPVALTEFDFLHIVCHLPGVRNEVIRFFAEKIPDAIHKRTTSPISRLAEYAILETPLALYWLQHARPESLESAQNQHWKNVYEICNLLWTDNRDDFVDVAVEQECWPLLQFFCAKKPKRYWAQEDPEEAWKHNPPQNTVTLGAITLIDQLVLPNFKRKAFELELPNSSWETEIVPNWLRNHPDLKLLYLNARDDLTGYVPHRVSNVLFQALAQNQSLDDFRMSGLFKVSWAAWTHFLHHAPKEVLVCSLYLDTGFDPTMDGPIPTPLDAAQSPVMKLDLFRISFVNPNSFLHLMQVITNLPKLEHLELVVDEPDDLDQQGLDEHKCTDAVMELIQQNRLKKLVFGPFPLSVIPISNLLRSNQTLTSLQVYFRAQQPNEFDHLVETVRDWNKTLHEYRIYELSPGPPRGVDETMNGCKPSVVFYTRLNRIDHGRLGRPEATKMEVIDLLLSARCMTIVNSDRQEADLEESYAYELLHKRPILWAMMSTNEKSMRGVKRKLED